MAETHLVAMYPELPKVESLLRTTEFSDLSKEPLETVYMGGGTPAMLGVEGIKGLVNGVNEVFSLSSIKEWTVEMSPAHIRGEMLVALHEMGVNRLSIGVQSFCDQTLKRIGRRHSTQDALAAVRLARANGFENTGVDLIAGLPEVTPAEWAETLEQAVALELPHLSVYALSVEEGTPLARQVGLGNVTIPDDEALLESLATTEEMLNRAGYERYEISNYARPGAACKHNVGIWRGNDFLGLGPAASSRIALRRWTNNSDLTAYMESVLQNNLPPRDEEELDPVADALERVTFALRLNEGFDPYTAAQRFPVLADKADRWEERLEACARQGLVERGGVRWRLTSRGREVCDAVLRDIF
jgi:oxygen-independent coproporphyrinogen-3 oxidase